MARGSAPLGAAPRTPKQAPASSATIWVRDSPCVCRYGWNREQFGAILGAVTGGILGTQIGNGSGRTAAIIGGSVLGVLVGGSVGRSMDRLDHLRFGQTLEYAPAHRQVRWRNPDTLVTYGVTPLASYRDATDRYCREYHTTAVIAGERQQIYGTACRQPDGSWEIAD